MAIHPKSTASITIRQYAPSDRQAVREVCIATGLRGRPINALLDHTEIWADLWTDYYLTREPDNCWVACDSGRVIGYLIGAADSPAADRYFASRILPKVAARAVLLGHWLSGRDRRFFARTIRAARKGQLDVPALIVRQYPGHYHFNLLEGFRSQGIGSRMYDLYEQRMRSLGVPGMHGQVLASNGVVVQFHRRRGYAEAFRQRVPSLSGYLEPGPVELVVFVKRF